jgi:hypothetical protein
MITGLGGNYLAKGMAKNMTLLCLSLVGNKIPSSTAGLIIEASILARGNVVSPCELDIPFNPPRNQEIIRMELDSVQYFDPR